MVVASQFKASQYRGIRAEEHGLLPWVIASHSSLMALHFIDLPNPFHLCIQ